MLDRGSAVWFLTNHGSYLIATRIAGAVTHHSMENPGDSMKRRSASRNIYRAAAVAALASVLAAASACSSSSGSSSSPSSGGSSSAAASNLSSFQKTVTAGEAGGSTFQGPSQSEAFKPPSGIKLGVLVSDASLPSAASSGTSVKQAAGLLGWHVTLYNGQGNPATENQVLEQAVLSHEDAVIMVGTDPHNVAGGLAAAHSKNIPVGSVLQFAQASSSGIAYDVSPNWEAMGKAQGALFVTDSKGKAVLLPLTDKEFGATVAYTQGTTETVQTCSTCKVLPLQSFVASDVASALGTRVVDQLHSSTSVSYLLCAYACPEVIPPMVNAGLTSNVKTGGIVNGPLDINNITKGNMLGGSTFNMAYAGYAAVDQIARLLAHKPLSKASGTTNPYYIYGENVPWALIVKSNAPASGTWQPKFNVESAYRKLWQLPAQ
jgi:ribose transport system substrate-binding protein